MQRYRLSIFTIWCQMGLDHRSKRLFFFPEPSLLSVRVTKQSRDRIAISMKTQGEIEAAICEGMTRFEQEFMGRGPKDIRAHLIGNLLVVRLQGVLTAAEQQLVKTLVAAKGRDLLKEVRTQLIETARPVMEALVQEATGVKAV